MKRNPDYLLERDGRYYARVVVPKNLRPFLGGRTEFRTPLGPDRRAALRRLHTEVGNFQHQIGLAKRAFETANGVTVNESVPNGKALQKPVPYPMTPEEIAIRDYFIQIEFDALARQHDHRFADTMVDENYVRDLKDGIAGRLTNDQLDDLIGWRIDRYRHRGNTDVVKGTPEWRDLAMKLCVSEYEVQERHFERNEGDFTGKPRHPLLANAIADPQPDIPPLSLKGLLDDYLAALGRIGKGREAGRRWTPVFADLARFIGHDDARRLTKKNLMDWRDEALKTLAPKTVADVYLASVRTVLSWAVANDKLEENVAEKVRQLVPKKKRVREQGFTLSEATRILRAARDYMPARTDNPRTTEAPETSAAKRWAPLLCAFSGARITEITQLRKQDIRREGDIPILRITPDAGTVKTGAYRDVPIHPQLVELGFLDFVNSAGEGPLFFSATKVKDAVTAARTVSGRVSNWLQAIGVVPEGVSPTHGWRHRFKTLGWELGISDRVLDAIQGHASRTAGDNYGDVTIKTRKAAIDRFPYYDLSDPAPSS